MNGVFVGAFQAPVASSYPKTIAASTQWNSFNPSSSGRRAYNSNSTYASPTYLDVPGWTWPAGGPLVVPGYQLQVMMTADRFEGCNGNSSHWAGLEIGGVGPIVTLQDQAATTAWANVANTVSGAVKMHDYATRTSGTAFTGNEILRYQYVRS